MKYLFENENAIELWFYITKELGVEMCPGDTYEDEVYISEKFLTDTLIDMNEKFEYDKTRKRFFRKV